MARRDSLSLSATLKSTGVSVCFRGISRLRSFLSFWVSFNNEGKNVAQTILLALFLRWLDGAWFSSQMLMLSRLAPCSGRSQSVNLYSESHESWLIVFIAFVQPSHSDGFPQNNWFECWAWVMQQFTNETPMSFDKDLISFD